MTTPEGKQIDMHFENGMTNVLPGSENLLGVNPVVMNHKIRYNKGPATGHKSCGQLYS